MTAAAAPTVKDQELVSLGLIESASVKSITDFTSSQLSESTVLTEKEDFANSFICHLIFYALFCVSIVLYILVDLGLGDFIKNKFIQSIEFAKSFSIKKSPVLA